MTGSPTVGGVCLATGLAAVCCPGRVLGLWPAREDAAARLMQAWGIASCGLGLVLCGVPPRPAVAIVAAASIPWDLRWTPAEGSPPPRLGMRHIAAALNAASIRILLK